MWDGLIWDKKKNARNFNVMYKSNGDIVLRILEEHGIQTIQSLPSLRIWT